MDDSQLLRYNRQIMMPQIDIAGQQKLLRSRVLIIGLGGLGSPAAMYLASSGIGHLVLVDHDQVELSNLQRQIIHDNASLGHDKVSSAKQRLALLNPEITISTINHKLDGDDLLEQVGAADVVVDASDNFATRFALNKACVQQATPLISGAVIRMEGQVAVYQPNIADSPCYRCLYHETEAPQETCSETGVLGPVAGIIGCIQATETIKVSLNLGYPLTGRLLILDAMTMEWRNLKLKKDPQCPVCTHK